MQCLFYRYFSLDVNQTLKECLAGKTIIEFPTFHVVLPDKTDMYVVQDSSTGQDAIIQPKDITDQHNKSKGAEGSENDIPRQSIESVPDKLSEPIENQNE